MSNMYNNEKHIKGIFKIAFDSILDKCISDTTLELLLDKFMYELFSKYVFTECDIEDYCTMYNINLYDKLVEMLKDFDVNMIKTIKDDNNETCKLTNICKYKI